MAHQSEIIIARVPTKSKLIAIKFFVRINQSGFAIYVNADFAQAYFLGIHTRTVVPLLVADG